MNNGTPKTLDQAIFRALTERMNQIDEGKHPLDRVHDILQDFIAQQFQTAYMEIGMWRDGTSTIKTPEEIIETLYERLTRRTT